MRFNESFYMITHNSYINALISEPMMAKQILHPENITLPLCYLSKENPYYYRYLIIACYKICEILCLITQRSRPVSKPRRIVSLMLVFLKFEVLDVAQSCYVIPSISNNSSYLILDMVSSTFPAYRHIG